ncbi:uncharacterized protein LOC124459292 [Xenia sp. Carnegie-2017]|uniref:uncharacterized protein LOC124459292 n=1 Tax=Xenia sp. Carnegie-2017 TaxID=2897299 RepID=UPI001F0389CE|nr:uncharacterized protein LOC124459292 [Xenia sp. Carnegie-2017]
MKVRPLVAKHLHGITEKIWSDETIPAELRDANIINIFKKNDRHNPNNYRGISLLAVARKIITLMIDEAVLPETKCGFRRNRGTSDMIFALRQLIEKSREQNQKLYMTFVDFTKAFDLVNHDCAFVANSEECFQRMMDNFEAATKSFGVIINTKKTEVMSLSYSPITSPITVNDTSLSNVQSFKYLGSTVTSDCSIDKELDNRIQCANTSHVSIGYTNVTNAQSSAFPIDKE